MKTPSCIIAIDGLAATGKGTLARRLAKTLGFAYLDTGLLYRAVGMKVLKNGGCCAQADVCAQIALAFDPAWLDDDALRSEQASQAASEVAAHPEVRAALLKFQKNFAFAPPAGALGAVLDGRDIGTVIAPDARVKIFVTASPEVRARRRFLELQAAGRHATEAAVLEDMIARDARDQTRSVAPTVPAKDAVVLDTSALNAQEAFAAALDIVKNKLA